jgi:hypothetical protein
LRQRVRKQYQLELVRDDFVHAVHGTDERGHGDVRRRELRSFLQYLDAKLLL